MHKDDEELLARLAKEVEKEGLEFDERRASALFHTLVERLIETPPATPEQKKELLGRRRARRRAARRK